MRRTAEMVKGVCLASMAVNDDNGVIVKRFSGTRLNTRVYASLAFIKHRYRGIGT